MMPDYDRTPVIASVTKLKRNRYQSRPQLDWVYCMNGYALWSNGYFAIYEQVKKPFEPHPTIEILEVLEPSTSVPESMWEFFEITSRMIREVEKFGGAYHEVYEGSELLSIARYAKKKYKGRTADPKVKLVGSNINPTFLYDIVRPLRKEEIAVYPAQEETVWVSLFWEGGSAVIMPYG